MKRDTKAAFVVFFGLVILLSATLFISPVNREPLISHQRADTLEKWEYMNGDLPHNQKGMPDFGLSGGDRWKRVDASNSTEAVDADIFWMRYRLPEAFEVNNPALFLQFDFPVEVYLSGQRIYSYGSMKDCDRVMVFQHLIPLLDDYRGEIMYFRYPAKKGLIVKDLKYLAGWETVSGDKKAKTLVYDELVPAALCIIELFIGLALAMMALTQIHSQKTEAKLLAFSGAFIMLDSVNILTCLYTVKAVLKQPVLLFYMDYATYFSIPFIAGGVIYNISEPKYKTLLKNINRIFMLFLASILMLSCIPGFDISRSDYVFNTSLLIYVVLIVYLLFKEMIEGKKELRIILAGMVAAGVFGFIDVLSNLNVIERSGYVSNIGVLILALSMVHFFGLRYTKMYEGVQAANKELLKSKEYIEEVNKELDRKVIEKTAAIRNLFDNADQGFLSFRGDLIIDEEYSHKCFEIFGFDISGGSFAVLMSSGNSEQKQLLESAFGSIFNEQEEARREVYISLLPTEFKLNNRIVNADYKLIENSSQAVEMFCMVILTDITEKRQLEIKLENEQAVLNMAVKIVAGYNDFVDIVKEYKEFFNNGINKIVLSGINQDKIFGEIFRTIHTFKGAFAQFGLINMASGLHGFETEMQNLKKRGFNAEDIEALCKSFSFEGLLKRDMTILGEKLGDKYTKFEKLVIVEESKVKEMEERIVSIHSYSDKEAILREFGSLKYRSLKEMLKHYPEYCMSLGEKLGKSINMFEIKGQDILVNPQIYSGLCKVLVHIFRNIADHGIESPEQRISAGKGEHGNVACELACDEKNVLIVIYDDGAGIDTILIRTKAIQDGLMSIQEAAAASDDEVISLIFKDSFSTKEEVTDLSGRGMGLSALRAEVEKLHGSIKVETVKGKGTCFKISVPLLISS